MKINYFQGSLLQSVLVHLCSMYSEQTNFWRNFKYKHRSSDTSNVKVFNKSKHFGNTVFLIYVAPFQDGAITVYNLSFWSFIYHSTMLFSNTKILPNFSEEIPSNNIQFRHFCTSFLPLKKFITSDNCKSKRIYPFF